MTHHIDDRERFVASVAARAYALPPIAGRIFATLLTADDDAISGPRLATDLGISAGSVSTMTRLLIRQGVVEKVRREGERADFFRCAINPEALTRLLLDNLLVFANMADELPSGLSDAAVERVRTMAEFYRGIAERIEPLTRVPKVSDRRRNKIA